MLIKRKPKVTSHKKYKHVIGDNGEDIRTYESSSSYERSFGETFTGENGKLYYRSAAPKSTMGKMLDKSEAMGINKDVAATDFKRGDYLKGIKHSFAVSKNTRNKFVNQTY